MIWTELSSVLSFSLSSPHAVWIRGLDKIRKRHCFASLAAGGVSDKEVLKSDLILFLLHCFISYCLKVCVLQITDYRYGDVGCRHFHTVP